MKFGTRIIFSGGLLAAMGSCFLLQTTALSGAVPEVTDAASLRQWREFILPAEEELKWKEIPWRGSFWKALAEAREQEKPLLLWAMNGHPLGCT